MEIERKFLIAQMPDLSNKSPMRYERYYLKRDNGIEERIQKKGDLFEHELKKEISSLERTKDKKEISEQEFEKMKTGASEAIIRDGYKIDDQVSIKIYHGKFKGLKRAEVEFDSRDEATAYIPESWMGKEITDSPLGRDSALLDLSAEEFQKLISHSF